MIDQAALTELIASTMRKVLDEREAKHAAAPTHSPLEQVEPKALAIERGLKCSDTVTKQLKKGSLRGQKIGGRWTILRGDVCPCPVCVAWAKEVRK